MLKLFSVIVLIFFTSVSFAEDKTHSPAMLSTYESFKAIQKIIYTNDPDQLIKSRDDLLKYVRSLKKSLHSFEEDKKKSQFPALNENLEHLLVELNSVEKSLKNNLAGPIWTASRLKAISTHCQSCHTTYKVEVNFKDPDLPKQLNQFQKAEFLLSSRQFKAAEKSYWDYLIKGDYSRDGVIHPLYRWLDLMVRVFNDPKQADSKLLTLIETENLSIYEESEVRQWLKALKAWEKQGGEIYLDFQKNKDLIADLIKSEEPLYSNLDMVTLLRAVAGFHKIIEKNQAKDTELSEALYLLGLIYVNTPVLYLYELPEIYLKSCIKNYPGTKEAQKAFHLLKQYITYAHTGSGGLHLDSEIRAELEKLYKIAHQDG